VTASSAGLGAGSEFVVRLPLCAAPARQLAPLPEPLQVDGSGRSVLLIDDNANFRLSMRLLLEIRGYHVSEAEDGRRGLHQLLAGRFDAAVVDLRMPEMDGFEVARQVRASPCGAALKLVALTGNALLDDRQQAERAGFDCVLVKPADPDQLTRALAP
jgi:CheY-like chemotaxis protein